MARTRAGLEKISCIGCVGLVAAACFHFSDSGTKSRTKNVSAAGNAPITTT